VKARIFNTYCIFFLVCFLSFFYSCSTLPKNYPANSYPSIDSFTPKWQYLEKGVDLLAGQISSPRLQFWAVRVDMAEPSLKIVVSGKAAIDGVFAENHIPSTTVSSFVRDNGCIVGINAAPFDRVSAREGEDRAIIGVTVSDGIVVASPAPRYDAIVFYADGKAAIVNQAELVRQMQSGCPAVWNAVGGFYAVLKDGEITERAVSEAGQKRHPRSAAGLGDSYLYLLAVDGRRLSSIGATEEEVAFLLQRLGARDGLNFDGGGSTALALRLPDGSVTVVNTPMHSGTPARERAVASCLGIGNRQ
jgi:hypothetical protein